MGLGCICTDSQETSGVTEITDIIRHGAAAEGSGQTGHSGGMSETGTVVNTVGTQYRSGEFLDNMVILIGALG